MDGIYRISDPHFFSKKKLNKNLPRCWREKKSIRGNKKSFKQKSPSGIEKIPLRDWNPEMIYKGKCLGGIP